MDQLTAEAPENLTGVPEELRPLLHSYSDDVVTFVQEQAPVIRQAATERMEAFDDRLRQVIIERRNSSDRPDDAMTALVEYRDENGQPLSDDKILLHRPRYSDAAEDAPQERRRAQGLP